MIAFALQLLFAASLADEIRDPYLTDSNAWGQNAYGGQASFQFSSTGLFLNITDPGTEVYHIQLIYYYLTFENGKSYNLSIIAKTEPQSTRTFGNFTFVVD